MNGADRHSWAARGPRPGRAASAARRPAAACTADPAGPRSQADNRGERLAADLWPDTGPADASNALQALVSRLRNAAGPDIIEHWPEGYQLALDSAAVDAGQFERLVATGRGALGAGDPEGGAAVLRQALTLWRGPALVDVEDAPLVGAEVGPGTCTGGRNPTRNRRLDPILGKWERQHGYDHRG